ncbi:MAG: aldo/keto reductase [Gemmatimonadetes bacterium]|nr:aldo/keto reductase [Gemmatimonadota bacterium]
MRTIPLGPDAPAVTVVGFGGMPLSLSDRPGETEAVRVIHAVLDAGVTLLDTADVYCLDDDDIGHNERLFAKALAGWSGDRDGLIVATKGGLTRPGGRWERNGQPEHIYRACDRSLAALGVERIDLYQFHAPDPDVPFAESAGAFARLRDEGKIRWVGLSNVSVDQIETARRVVPITSVQNRLNPFFREAVETGVVRYCAREGIGFLAYSPVGGGRLNKKLPTHPVLRPIAARHGVSPHAVVLAWVAARGATVIPIPAARSVAHALDSVSSAAVSLSADELKAIDDAKFSRA